MSKWDDFKKSVETLADKTVNKTRELTDTAALKIKIANKEADRDTEYKNLGKLAYTKLKNPEGTSDEITRQIHECMARLDVICQELSELKKEEEDRKNAKEAEKEAKAAAKKHRDEDELDTSVMDSFNEARKEADAEYEVAKQEAEHAQNDAEDAKASAEEAKETAENA